MLSNYLITSIFARVRGLLFGLITLLALLGLAGCTGMYMGIQADDDELPELTQEKIHARADILRITPLAVQRLRDERYGSSDIIQSLLYSRLPKQPYCGHYN